MFQSETLDEFRMFSGSSFGCYDKNNLRLMKLLQLLDSRDPSSSERKVVVKTVISL